eukprot:4157806-Prymnesium_polylepis.1
MSGTVAPAEPSSSRADSSIAGLSLMYAGSISPLLTSEPESLSGIMAPTSSSHSSSTSSPKSLAPMPTHSPSAPPSPAGS